MPSAWRDSVLGRLCWSGDLSAEVPQARQQSFLTGALLHWSRVVLVLSGANNFNFGVIL